MHLAHKNDVRVLHVIDHLLEGDDGPVFDTQDQLSAETFLGEQGCHHHAQEQQDRMQTHI